MVKNVFHVFKDFYHIKSILSIYDSILVSRIQLNIYLRYFFTILSDHCSKASWIIMLKLGVRYSSYNIVLMSPLYFRQVITM